MRAGRPIFGNAASGRLNNMREGTDAPGYKSIRFDGLDGFLSRAGDE